MSEEQFRIPKIHVPIVCHMLQGEQISGEIFLDMVSAEGYTTEEVLDFFNTPTHFFPILLNDQHTILLQKKSVVRVDVPGLLAQFQDHIYSFVVRKDAILHLQTYGPIKATLVLELPEYYSRTLDLLNKEKDFFPALLSDSLALINIHHTWKIEEL